MQWGFPRTGLTGQFGRTLKHRSDPHPVPSNQYQVTLVFQSSINNPKGYPRLKTGSSTSIQNQASSINFLSIRNPQCATSIQFPLTFRGVKYKQQPAVFPNLFSFFNPDRARGFKMDHGRPIISPLQKAHSD